MTPNQLKDIIEWDIVNWSKAIPYWEKHTNLNNKKLKCLELGGRKGGLSLWLALKGHDVVCSDYESPESTAKPLHDKYKLDNITYKNINATKIPYDNEFDLVIFKSILGSVAKQGKDSLKQETINQIHQSLKPGGKFIFAENLQASKLHQFFRKKFTKWGANWNYLKHNEIELLLSNFSKVHYTSVGFWGAFGRNEKQRNFLGKIDNWFEKLVPNKMHYIVIGVAEK